MNKKTLCLLVFLCICLSTVHASVLDYITNQADWFQATRTVIYCFNIGWFNVFSFNDGGLAFYTCLDSYFKTIRFL